MLKKGDRVRLVPRPNMHKSDCESMTLYGFRPGQTGTVKEDSDHPHACTKVDWDDGTIDPIWIVPMLEKIMVETIEPDHNYTLNYYELITSFH